jgi:hypothetical protein
MMKSAEEVTDDKEATATPLPDSDDDDDDDGDEANYESAEDNHEEHVAERKAEEEDEVDVGAVTNGFASVKLAPTGVMAALLAESMKGLTVPEVATAADSAEEGEGEATAAETVLAGLREEADKGRQVTHSRVSWAAASEAEELPARGEKAEGQPTQRVRRLDKKHGFLNQIENHAHQYEQESQERMRRKDELKEAADREQEQQQEEERQKRRQNQQQQQQRPARADRRSLERDDEEEPPYPGDRRPRAGRKEKEGRADVARWGKDGFDELQKQEAADQERKERRRDSGPSYGLSRDTEGRGGGVGRGRGSRGERGGGGGAAREKEEAPWERRGQRMWDTDDVPAKDTRPPREPRDRKEVRVRPGVSSVYAPPKRSETVMQAADLVPTDDTTRSTPVKSSVRTSTNTPPPAKASPLEKRGRGFDASTAKDRGERGERGSRGDKGTVGTMGYGKPVPVERVRKLSVNRKESPGVEAEGWGRGVKGTVQSSSSATLPTSTAPVDVSTTSATTLTEGGSEKEEKKKAKREKKKSKREKPEREGDPLLIMKLETSKGMRALKFYQGDDPATVANHFCAKYGLGGEEPSQRQVYTEALAGHISKNLDS